MRYDGKKTDRMQLPQQLRADPELGAAVRFLAQINRRSIQLQILHWILEGVEEEKAKLCQAASAGAGSTWSPPRESQAASGEILPAPPKSVSVSSGQFSSRRKEDAA